MKAQTIPHINFFGKYDWHLNGFYPNIAQSAEVDNGIQHVGQDFYSYVKSTGISIVGSEGAFIDAINDGFVSISHTVSSNIDAENLDDLSNKTDEFNPIAADTLKNALNQSSVKVSGDYELELYVKTGLGNGEYAFNPWLHEMPDPISMMTYDNYISMNPADVMKLLKLEDTKGNRRSALYLSLIHI